MKEKAPLKITAKQSNNWYDDRLIIKLSSNKLSTGQRTRIERTQKAPDSNRIQTQLPHLLTQPKPVYI